MDRARTSYDGCTHVDGHAEHLMIVNQRPFEEDGRLHLPAGSTEISTATFYGSGDTSVQLDLLTTSMNSNQLALFVRLTPEGARHLAAGLVAEAARVEEKIAAQATAAIEAARTKGGGS